MPQRAACAAEGRPAPPARRGAPARPPPWQTRGSCRDSCEAHARAHSSQRGSGAPRPGALRGRAAMPAPPSRAAARAAAVSRHVCGGGGGGAGGGACNLRGKFCTAPQAAPLSPGAPSPSEWVLAARRAGIRIGSQAPFRLTREQPCTAARPRLSQLCRRAMRAPWSVLWPDTSGAFWGVASGARLGRGVAGARKRPRGGGAGEHHHLARHALPGEPGDGACGGTPRARGRRSARHGGAHRRRADRYGCVGGLPRRVSVSAVATESAGPAAVGYCARGLPERPVPTGGYSQTRL